MNDIAVTVAFTNFNRTDFLFEAMKPFMDDARVNEIVVVDDDSEQTKFFQVNIFCSGNPKIRLYKNEKNLGCYRNKREAVSKASNEWVLLLDSDNVFSSKYMDRIENLMTAGVNPKTLYQPDFARPHFNFEQFGGSNFVKGNIGRNAENDTFCTMLNAMNYFVNRDEYLRVWQDRDEPWTADSLLQNYNWLNAGNSIYVVPGLQYDHRVHEGSHYKENVRKTGNLYNEIVHKLRLL